MNHTKLKEIKRLNINDLYGFNEEKWREIDTIVCTRFNQLLEALQEEERSEPIGTVKIYGKEYMPVEENPPEPKEESLESLIERCGEVTFASNETVGKHMRWIANHNYSHSYAYGPTPTEAVKALLKEMGK